MSGWDVSSTPTWGPQDGPDETQAFSAQGNGARDYGQDFGNGYQGENMAGGPPPEFFGQEYGQDHDLGPSGYPQRTPGQSLQQDLPRRDAAPNGRHHGGTQQSAGYGQDNGGFPGDNGYGQDPGFGRDAAFGQDPGFGQDWGGNGPDQGGDPWGAPAPGGAPDDGGWGRNAGRSAAPWDERPQDGYGDPNGFGRQPENPGFASQDYGGQDFHGQDFPGPGRGGAQAPTDFGGGRGTTARNDPALQDFFAPTGGGGGYADQGGWPGGGGGAARPVEDPDVDWTGRPRKRPAEEPELDWTGRPKRSGPPPRDDDDEESRGIGMKGLVAIGAVVIVVIAAAAYMFLHKGSSTPTASNSPTSGTSSAPAAPTGSAAASGGAGAGAGGAASGGGGGAKAAGFTLSTPDKAGGLPKGNDPNDIKNATATAAKIVAAVKSGDGGSATGDPVSAAYTLPGNQAITFVGYTGTFTPDKVVTALASLGTDAKAYDAGANGGDLSCINTTAKPSGAVCVWSTDTTLGITEFYDSAGPETLTSSQNKGAEHTVDIRADVEKKG